VTIFADLDEYVAVRLGPAAMMDYRVTERLN
jgi:hypothetical protein